jgi:hypothetical protein
MDSRSDRLIRKSFLLIVLSFVMIILVQGQIHLHKVTVNPNISLSDIRNYRSLIQVNEKPIDMQEETKMMCAMPSNFLGPHYSPGIVYYINTIARNGVKTFNDKKLFPIGSLIVKEKQERKTEDSVQIITIMKKVRTGRGENTWDYKMYNVKKWEAVDSSRQVSRPTCIGCHQRYKNNDYISDKGMSLLRGDRG